MRYPYCPVLGLAFMLFLLGCVFPCLLMGGGEPAYASEDSPSDSLDEQNREYFTDLKVLTHEGEELRFYSDLLREKIVAINFFYIHCPSPQPSLETFFKLQKMLQSRLGTEILLLTLTVDPTRDTPVAIRDYAKKFNPQKGWHFLTGDADNMEKINQKLGNTRNLPEGHLRLILLGNLKTGHWMKVADDVHEFSLKKGLQSLDPMTD
jgi:protein SCO1